MPNLFGKPTVTNHVNKSYAKGGMVDDEDKSPIVQTSKRGFDEASKMFGRTHPGNLTRHAKGGMVGDTPGGGSFGGPIEERRDFPLVGAVPKFKSAPPKAAAPKRSKSKPKKKSFQGEVYGDTTPKFKPTLVGPTDEED